MRSTTPTRLAMCRGENPKRSVNVVNTREATREEVAAAVRAGQAQAVARIRALMEGGAL